MLDWKSLVSEHYTWEQYNFGDVPITQCLMGVQEEIGELTHHYLKMKQNIRGNTQEHLDEMQDAVGDATVYLLGVMSHWNVEAPYPINLVNKDDPEVLILALGIHAAGLNAVHFGEQVGALYAITKFVHSLRRWCHIFGWDYDEIVQRTWDKVKQRDWTKNKTDGSVAPNVAEA